MGKEAGLLFTVPVRVPFWVVGETEPLIISLFLLIVSRRNWKGPWTIRGINQVHVEVRSIELGCKQEWEQP